MEKLDCVVIGAGVVGIAVARSMAMAGREVYVLEESEGIGNHASSRNSEIIHAGIYYPTGSLKAKLCVQGRDLLYNYCEAKNIRNNRIGKLVVAVDDGDIPKLEAIDRQARINGVDDLVWLIGSEIRELEPLLQGERAILSPSTGIVDSHGLMLALLSDAEQYGAIIAFASPLLGGRLTEEGVELDIGGTDPMTFQCDTVINCGGVQAQAVARSLEGFPESCIPDAFMCKGNYFSCSVKPPFSRLIYPVPDEAGLGIHLTFDLSGQARFGPDTEWVDEFDYQIDERRVEIFYGAIRRYWPKLPSESLQPDYCGIRAKISGPYDAVADFQIQGPETHGVLGLVNLFGIESPGLTASMAIADEVVDLVCCGPSPSIYPKAS